ncbi:MAG: hypothetical protein WCO03_00745, partial [bacterium]
MKKYFLPLLIAVVMVLPLFVSAQVADRQEGDTCEGTPTVGLCATGLYCQHTNVAATAEDYGVCTLEDANPDACELLVTQDLKK